MDLINRLFTNTSLTTGHKKKFSTSPTWALLTILAIVLIMPLQPAHGELSGSYQKLNSHEAEALAGIVANPESAIQDILARIVPPDSESTDPSQFEVNLRLADTQTLYKISETINYEDAVKTLSLRVNANDMEPNALGDISQDYVYTAVTPCRLADTRATGIVSDNSTRDFFAYGSGAIIGNQGGNPLGCASPRGEPRAVHINATVVASASGFLTVYPASLSQVPNVSLLNFTAGTVVANAGIIQTQFSITDPELRVFAKGDTHVIIDVLGYFHDVDAIDPRLLPIQTLSSVEVLDNDGVATASCPSTSSIISANCACDNKDKNFGFVFACLVQGNSNSAVGGCFSPFDDLYDSAKPYPGVVVQAVCKTVGPAIGITAASSVKAISRSASSEDPDLLKTLQSFRDQLLRRTKALEARK
jgi:hypothetical protein